MTFGREVLDEMDTGRTWSTPCPCAPGASEGDLRRRPFWLRRNRARLPMPGHAMWLALRRRLVLRYDIMPRAIELRAACFPWTVPEMRRLHVLWAQNEIGLLKQTYGSRPCSLLFRHSAARRCLICFSEAGAGAFGGRWPADPYHDVVLRKPDFNEPHGNRLEWRAPCGWIYSDEGTLRAWSRSSDYRLCMVCFPEHRLLITINQLISSLEKSI